MRVQLLCVPGCPHAALACERATRLLAEAGADAVVELVEVGDDEAARRLGFLGSPTLRIDGVDVEPGAATGRTPGLACRVYVDDDGVDTAPPERWIRRALSPAPPGP